MFIILLPAIFSYAPAAASRVHCLWGTFPLSFAGARVSATWPKISGNRWQQGGKETCCIRLPEGWNIYYENYGTFGFGSYRFSLCLVGDAYQLMDMAVHDCFFHEGTMVPFDGWSGYGRILVGMACHLIPDTSLVEKKLMASFKGARKGSSRFLSPKQPFYGIKYLLYPN